jgi:hypothetical protein
MTEREADRRNRAGRAAREQAFQQQSLYARIWSHLWERGLIYSTGAEDQKRAMAAFQTVDRREQCKERRKQRKLRRRMRR